MKNKKIISLNIEDIFPFYIDNVNIKFFNSLNQIPNKKFVNKILPRIKKTLDEEELEKFIELDNLTKLEKVNLMLNLALKKIVSKTGSYNCDIFKTQTYDKFNEPMYIKNVELHKDIEIVSDNLSERRYNFVIETNENSYLNMYVKKISLSFYLDDETKILSGGFALQLFEGSVGNSGSISEEKTVDLIYLSNLIRHYISKQLYPISLDNIVDMVSEYIPTPEQNKNRNATKLVKNHTNSSKTWNSPLNFKGVTANDLKDNWNELIHRKYLKFRNDLTDDEKKLMADNLFFSILITTMITLSLYQELKIYFTSEKPELILKILDRPSSIKEDPNQNPEADFFELAKFISQNYFKKKLPAKNNYKQIKKFDDVIELVSEHQAAFDYESYGTPIPIYSVQTDDEMPFVSSKKVVTENMTMRIIYLMTISPELFGMNQHTSFFIEYGQLLKVIEHTKNNLGVSDRFKEKIEKSRCEINNNYVTYISDAPSILIIKNEPIPLFGNYFWAEIYAQSRIWIRNDLEFDINNHSIKKNTNFYRDKIKVLENLAFDWYDDFYGLSEIKGIVKKIDAISDIKNSIDILISKLKQQDSINKKDTERRTMVMAFIVATIIGLINFFGMVFTILAVGDIDAGLTPVNIASISVASMFSLVLAAIIIYFSVSIYKRRKKRN